MKFLVRVGFAWCLLAGAASAGDWRLIAVNDSSISGIDVTSGSMVEGRARMWVVRAFAETSEDGSDFEVAQWEADCSTSMVRFAARQTYSMSGDPVAAIPVGTTMYPVIPGTQMHDIYRVICEGHLPDPQPSTTTFQEFARLGRATLAQLAQ